MTDTEAVTYQIIGDNEAIMCLMCGLSSFHKEDVRRKYCAHCGVFHDDMARKIAESERKAEVVEMENAEKRAKKKKKVEKPRVAAVAVAAKLGVRVGLRKNGIFGRRFR